jgi:hypothetical protein
MKTKLIVIFVSAWVFWLTGGCQNQFGPGRVMLPPEVAGVWKAYDSPWKIVLSPDGKVVSAVIPMGEVEVRPNRTTKAEMLDGSISTYKAGNFTVEYTPQTRELFVTVEMKSIHIRFMNERIDGNSTDRFAGPVSKDGKVWMADWIMLFDYGPRFPQNVNDPNNTFGGQLVFEKVKD